MIKGIYCLIFENLWQGAAMLMEAFTSPLCMNMGAPMHQVPISPSSLSMEYS